MYQQINTIKKENWERRKVTLRTFSMTRERRAMLIKYFSRLVAEISEYLGRIARSRLDRDGNEKSLRCVSTSCSAAVTPVSPSWCRSFLTWKKIGCPFPVIDLIDLFAISQPSLSHFGAQVKKIQSNSRY